MNKHIKFKTRDEFTPKKISIWRRPRSILQGTVIRKRPETKVVFQTGQISVTLRKNSKLRQAMGKDKKGGLKHLPRGHMACTLGAHHQISRQDSRIS